MIQFAVIGLICTNLGCYWVQDDKRTVFADQTECSSAASIRKAHSAMYFDTACIVVNSQDK